ncbi:hypothetical protein DCC81_04045 [Chitinophaga parva]|uniref:DUF2306 domain-containing protein n=1 Tax=Chitinophaga parva TaxID=2169414 RepID=A0A2T7BLV8_9BACT|nr:hypothetical protein [Chitinophaga parva]PUZ28664.1 hypothetical protein DCC81_04045 [Chitinophaga parva]
MQTTHLINIGLHVAAGTAALVAGLGAMVVQKRRARHTRYGRVFTRLVYIVISTALFGVFVFRGNAFLFILTLLSGYNCFSGIRAVRLAGARPQYLDHLVAGGVMLAGAGYLYVLKREGFYWAPAVIYSTVGALFLVAGYDLLKRIQPLWFLQKAVLYEHSYKMVSAWSALLSAFCGTMLPRYKPYSQLLPSAICIAYICFTFIRIAKHQYQQRHQPAMQKRPSNAMI